MGFISTNHCETQIGADVLTKTKIPTLLRMSLITNKIGQQVQY